MVEKHSPSDSHTYNKLQKSAAALSIAASALMAGCSRSAEMSAQSEEALISDSTQSIVATENQQSNSEETVVELYESKPTREWNFENVEDLTTNWNNLNEKQQLVAAETFLENNIEGLDLRYWERSPEGITRMMDNMQKVWKTLVELSWNDGRLDVAKNIATVLSDNDEARGELIDLLELYQEMEQEHIGKPYDPLYEEFRASTYRDYITLRQSDEFFPVETIDEEKKKVGGRDLVLATAIVDKSKYIEVFCFARSNHELGYPGGPLRFRHYYTMGEMPEPFDIGSESITIDSLIEEAKGKGY